MTGGYRRRNGPIAEEGSEAGAAKSGRREGGREGGGAEARGEPAGERGVVAIIKVGAIVYH